MPIPDFDENGCLPVGVHACTIAEVEERFGRFRSTSRRPMLFGQLQSYLREARDAGVVKAVVINGSFVTSVATPNDVDIVVVLREDHDFGAEITPSEYNVLSARGIRRRHGFDVLVARDSSGEYAEYLAFYQQVRGQPGLRKGILRVDL